MLLPVPPTNMAGKVKAGTPCCLFAGIFIAAVLACQAAKLGPKEVLIVVLSQGDEYHEGKANLFKEHLEKQATDMEKPTIYMLHENWHGPGSWTIFPILDDLPDLSQRACWVFFCEEDTRIDLIGLLDTLKKFNKTEDWFLGRGLRDKEATIIHHFAFHENPSEFAYPSFAAGFALSMPLIKKLAKRLFENPKVTDFSIDAKHELAMYIWNKGYGKALHEVPQFCYEEKGKDCVTTYPAKFPNCTESIIDDDIFFAVKTCEKFHKERVPFIKKTWAKDAKHIEFYSEKVDKSIPTIDLGVDNTERGHCGKTLAIIRRAVNDPEIKKKKWLVIADDDTLLNVRRLQQLLGCYNPKNMVYLGERYGYNVAAKEPVGYDYITGGGGMVMSMTAARMLIITGMCNCPSDDAPDDMTLGMCFKHLGVPVVHSPSFHQARPNDYSDGYLKQQIPISFHKFWMVDPLQVYDQWLKDKTDSHSHDEL